MAATPEKRPRRQPHHHASQPPQTVRVGLLGLGNVGQAVARLAVASRGQLRRRGIDLLIAAALVRDAERAREFAPAGSLVTDDFEQFAAQPLDLVIEVMGGVHPAFDYLERFLQQGVPIVTANKALMAARGVELFRIAADYGSNLRCEASAIAGVPFLSALRDRPLVARVQRLSGILNGTSNYILSSMAEDGVSFTDALRMAQEKGFAEPDPSLDIDGIDAAEKLVVILEHLGITGVRVSALEVSGIDRLRVSDFRQAQAFGGVLKPIVAAEITEDIVRAFVGPAFVPATHPLATVRYERNGVRLWGTDIGDLVFTGPGAGPEITAATILDDATQIVAEGRDVLPPAVTLGVNDRRVEERSSPWFVRIALAGSVDAPTATHRVAEALAAAGVSPRHLATSPNGDTETLVYVLTHARPPAAVQEAVAALEQQLAADVVAFRALLE